MNLPKASEQLAYFRKQRSNVLDIIQQIVEI